MDEFDLALMEALNESVPSAAFTPDLADRLVRRTRHRSRCWKVLLAFGMASAALGAALTVATVLSDETDARLETADEVRGNDAPVASGFGEMTTHPATPSSQAISTSQQGATQVQNTTIKTAAALAGALTLSAANPSAAVAESSSGGDDQFIVSGYPAENPSRSDVSDGASLAVGALGDVSGGDALEARARTSDVSAGRALRSDKYKAMFIIFK